PNGMWVSTFQIAQFLAQHTDPDRRSDEGSSFIESVSRGFKNFFGKLFSGSESEGEVVEEEQVEGRVDNTSQAWDHYMNGNGAPSGLGPNTVNALLNHSTFQYRHNRIVSGQTTLLTGNFGVNMTGSVFHV